MIKYLFLYCYRCQCYHGFRPWIWLKRKLKLKIPDFWLCEMLDKNVNEIMEAEDEIFMNDMIYQNKRKMYHIAQGK